MQLAFDQLELRPAGPDRLADATHSAAAVGVLVDELTPRGDDASRVGATNGMSANSIDPESPPRALRSRSIFSRLSTTITGSPAVSPSRMNETVRATKSAESP
jgi:hypothetical protein